MSLLSFEEILPTSVIQFHYLTLVCVASGLWTVSRQGSVCHQDCLSRVVWVITLIILRDWTYLLRT